MFHDPARCRLGKAKPRHDSRTLKLAKYLKPEALPPLPAMVDYTAAVKNNWPMMLNDSLGDCTIAAVGHCIELWTADAGTEFIAPDPQILAAYETLGGYVPGDASTDNGCVELDVLNYWRQTGIAGHKINAYASIDFTNQTDVKATLMLFGAAYIGVALPLSAQSQDVWDVPPGFSPGFTLTGEWEPDSWGGHAVPLVAYDANGLTCITWGAPKRLTWAWLAAYADEAYAVLSPDWIRTSGTAPSGFDLAQLQSDLAAVTA